MTYQTPIASDFFVYQGRIYRVAQHPQGQMPQGLDYSVHPPNEELRQKLIDSYHQNTQATIVDRTVSIRYFANDQPHDA